MPLEQTPRPWSEWRGAVSDSARPPIVITAQDRNRLSTLLNAVTERDQAASCFLQEELTRADIVDRELAATSVVRMGSEVIFIDRCSTKVRQVRLTYPNEASDSRSVSVLSPLGSALIGLGPGQSIGWTENGIERRLAILEIRPTEDPVSGSLPESQDDPRFFTMGRSGHG
jgi:regulator of nucleoside diphosphate kinase